jgi:hypothetical protein
MLKGKAEIIRKEPKRGAEKGHHLIPMLTGRTKESPRDIREAVCRKSARWRISSASARRLTQH